MNEKIKQLVSVEDVKKQIRSVQSRVCRLNKQKSRPDYEKVMADLSLEERLLKARLLEIEPKKMTITTMSEEQLKTLDYNETVRAIKSIQSKKCLEQYNDDQTEYKRALEIEQILMNHRENMKPVDEQHIRKSDVMNLIETLENTEKVSKKKMIEMLKDLIK